ncbi:MAG TPA: hypothetical protein VKZ51_13395 [Cyclobacteriaceae bacterium]|nr:hypothetical protein [Cyclobacteriaceae bacterium]
MGRTFPNITKKHFRQLAAFAAAMLIVLMSCSVKSSIKSLVGIPVNTEQGVGKKHHGFFGSASETCVLGETADIKFSQAASYSANDLLPAVLLTATFLFLFENTVDKGQSHPLYGSLKIPGSLPLFLLYRKLIVYHYV